MRDFEQQWENNRKRLHGLLVYLVKDIDLADDLLQETYLRAERKFETYKGGDFGAWLAAIARNLALGHLRRVCVKGESSISEDHEDAAHEDTGTESHLEAMLVRNAVDNLSPKLRNALILKHYGGFNYPEIAARLDCPVGTAKRRVWTAIRQLRAALGIYEEAKAMRKCLEMTMLLDYAYGALPEARRKEVEAHLVDCEACRGQSEGVRGVVASLQSAREQMVFTDITDILADGSAVTYSPGRTTNDSDEPSSGYSFDSMKYHRWQSVFADGEEMPFTVTDLGDGEYNRIDVKRKRPLAPGESAFCLGVYTTPEGIGASFDIGHGRRIAVPDNSGTDSSDHLLVQMVRLPEGAELIGSVPVSDEVKTGARTTLVWRRLVPAGEIRERPVVVYRV